MCIRKKETIAGKRKQVAVLEAQDWLRNKNAAPEMPSNEPMPALGNG
jgi:hypothetical protein